jgi:hypothetical protein
MPIWRRRRATSAPGAVESPKREEREVRTPPSGSHAIGDQAEPPESPERPDSPEPLRVVIADDHPFHRDGLAGLLRASGVDVVAEVASGKARVRWV